MGQWKLIKTTKISTFKNLSLGSYFYHDDVYWQKIDPAVGQAIAGYVNDAGLSYKGFFEERVIIVDNVRLPDLET